MKKLVLIGCVLLGMSSCYNDKYDKMYPSPTVTCDTSTTTYMAVIKPIIIANCYSPGNGCHDAVGAVTSGFDFETNLDMLQATANSGDLMADITGASGNLMPKNGTRLPDCDIAKIRRWVNNGAQNN